MTTALRYAGTSTVADAQVDVPPVAVARRAVREALGRGSWRRTDAHLLDDVREVLALRAQVDALLLDAVAEVDVPGPGPGLPGRDRGPSC